MKFILLLLLAVSASTPQPVASASPLSEAAMLAHIRYLADDRLEGRKPGTPGADRTVEYIQRQFSGMGLHVSLQPVDLIERQARAATVRWTGPNGPISIAPADSVFTGRAAHEHIIQAPVVFAGYGLALPKSGHDDLNGIDLRGAVVLLLSGRPKGLDDAPGLEVRRAAIVARGAIAVIALAGVNDPWGLIRDRLAEGRTVLAEAKQGRVEGALAPDAWETLLTKSGLNPAKAVSAATVSDFRAYTLPIKASLDVRTRLRPIRSVNVIGKIEGSDRPQEALVYLAHWDHLGLCAPPDAKDRICNGAIDNASGVAMLIEVARALAKGPRPKRSIFFISTTAEEMGLLGARTFSEHPPVPLLDIVAAINFDTVAIAPAGRPVAVIGRGRTALDGPIDHVAKSLGRTVEEDDTANAFLNRQDGYELLKVGVPSVMLGGAFNDLPLLTDFLTSRYHHPDDDLLHPIELSGAAEDGALHIALGRYLTDPALYDPPRRH